LLCDFNRVCSLWLPPVRVCYSFGRRTTIGHGFATFGAGLLGSSYLSTVTNGVIVTVLYSSAFIAGLMEQVGIFLQNTVMERLGILVSLVVPSDALWRFAAQHMAAAHTAAFGGPGLFTSSMPPTAWIAVWSVGEVALAVALACWAFSGRDL